MFSTCPFCGGSPTESQVSREDDLGAIVVRSVAHRVYCHVCDVGMMDSSYSKLVERWNRREGKETQVTSE